ncbi:hypothetical protein TNCV_4736821 [Trichonephila clavipes]|nr:hypothetical protein TNCV_4736821 [Trichonephila clavipes]
MNVLILTYSHRKKSGGVKARLLGAYWDSDILLSAAHLIRRSEKKFPRHWIERGNHIALPPGVPPDLPQHALQYRQVALTSRSPNLSPIVHEWDIIVRQLQSHPQPELNTLMLTYLMLQTCNSIPPMDIRFISPCLIEDETFNDSGIINSLIDYENEQEEPDSLRADKNMQGYSFPTNWKSNFLKYIPVKKGY